jgi:thymidylate kinase
MHPHPGNPRRTGKSVTHQPVLISFSGLDGSGKSTHIESLRAALHLAGLTTRRLAFWDDVVVGAKFREGFVHKVYKSERGIGAPGKPVNRRDKNMRGWYLSILRHVLYLLDALNLRRVIAREQKAARKAAEEGDLSARTKAINRDGFAWTRPKDKNSVNAILLDRYIYDELANLDLTNAVTRAFVRLVCGFTPRPDLAYLIDAEPGDACTRKPEYPVEFMTRCRESYFKLAGLAGSITVIPALSLADARMAVLKTAEQSLTAAGYAVDLVSRNVISGNLSVA